MVDAASIIGAVQGLKAASDLAGSAMKARDAAALQAKVAELYGVILAAQRDALSAQGEQSALLKRIDELEKQLAQREDWERQRERYELREVAPGSFAYALKESAASGEPQHMLCPNCYEHQRRSVLQATSGLSARRHRIQRCPGCGAEVEGSLNYRPEGEAHAPELARRTTNTLRNTDVFNRGRR